MRTNHLIGGRRAAPGTRLQGWMAVDGAPDLPVTLLNGREEGPTVLILAGTHGTEYPGILAAIQLSHKLDPAAIRGAVILVHLLNRPQFAAGTPFVGPDGENLNASYPGDPRGSVTGRLAAAVTEQLLPHADFLLDLHSGDLPETLTPHIYYPAGGSAEVESAAIRAAEAFGIRWLVASRSQVGAVGTAARMGIPGLLVEIGEGGRWEASGDVARFVAGTEGVLRQLGVLPGVAERHEVVLLDHFHSLYAGEDGLWLPAVQVGERTARGERVGKVVDPFGSELAGYRAPIDGMVLYQTASLAVRRGDHLIAMAAPR